MQPQLAYQGIPANIHLSVTASVAPRAAEFGAALREAADAARAAGPVALPAEVLALVAQLKPDDLTPELVAGLAAQFGLGDPTAGPPRMAAVNTILAAADPRLRERLLVEFLSLLQSPGPPVG